MTGTGSTGPAGLKVSSPAFMSHNNTSDPYGSVPSPMERDSLMGTMETADSGTSSNSSKATYPDESENSYNSVLEDQDQDQVTTPKDGSILAGTTGTDLSMIKENSDEDSELNEAIEDGVHKNAVSGSVDSQPSSTTPCWTAGRAPMELIEFGERPPFAGAFDVYIGAIQFYRKQNGLNNSGILVSIEFLGVDSSMSNKVQVINNSAVIGFSSYMRFNNDNAHLLREEIEEWGDQLSFQVNVFGSDGQVIGQAQALLWVMVEDSCNLHRQDIDLLMDDDLIGSVVVDVRGYRVLQKFS